jgi:hypothetical protein
VLVATAKERPDVADLDVSVGPFLGYLAIKAPEGRARGSRINACGIMQYPRVLRYSLGRGAQLLESASDLAMHTLDVLQLPA